jgi:spermidine synthase
VQQKTWFFYLLSFIEGGSVMAAELIGAKMLAPFFGSSLYVWSTVMAVTLGGLAMGYFCGGILSYKRKGKEVLYYVMFIAAVLVILMPFTSKIIFAIIGDRALLPSLIASTTLFLLPPVFMMGMVSPLIIRSITTVAEEAGKAAGAVYAVSTLGGIISTFLTGFWIIPTFGLSGPCLVIGIVLGILPLVLIMKKNKLAPVYFVALLSWSFYKMNHPLKAPGITIPYRSEGLLGQLMVADYPVRKPDGSVTGTNRLLFVNRMTQTQLNDGDSITHFSYVDKITTGLHHLKPGSHVLLLGLGGGSLANELVKMGFETDVCELDPRIAFVARKWFWLNNRVNVSVDDARHFIRHTDEKYDVVIFDVFKGEEIPGQCFTREAFLEVRKIMKAGGVVIVNGNGFYEGSRGRGMKSVCLTFAAAGFHISLSPTSSNQALSNLVFFASPDSSSNEDALYYASVFGKQYVDIRKMDFSDAMVMTDDTPVLDQLNAEAYKSWRSSSISYFTSEMQKGRGIPVFE